MNRVVTIEDLRREIREHGITRTARELGLSRQYLQRVCGGQRQPGPRLLAKLRYKPITVYFDLTTPQKTPGQAS